MRNRLTGTISLIAVTTSLGFISPALAQLDEITVTAQKREQTLQDVPISISAVSGDSIEKRGFDNFSDLSAMVPNLFIGEGKIDSSISIRGVVTGQNKGFEQSVGMYVDGISYGRSQLVRLPMVDLERVEVLRGPQPTLFGKNAIAGAVSVITAKPTDEFEGKLSASHEFNHDEYNVMGVISGPLGPSGLRGRLVASYRDMDGYFTNTLLNRKEPQREELYFRGQLAWDNGGNFEVNLKGEYAEFDTTGYGSEPNNPVGTYSILFDGSPFPAVDTVEDYRRASGEVHSFNDITNLVLNANYQLGDHTITSVTGYVEYDTQETIDVDYLQFDILDGTNQTENYEQFSQELRLTSPGGNTIDYIAGLYFQTSDLAVTDQVMLGSFFAGLPAPFSFVADSFSARDYAQSSDLYSAFAQADIHISDNITLTAGARFSHENKDGARNQTINGGPTNVAVGLPSPSPAFPNLLEAVWGGGLNIAAHSVAGTRKEDNFDPLVRLQIEPTDTISFYASYTQGSKAGGFDIRGNSVPGQPVPNPGTFEFEDEGAKNYEVGAKFRTDNAEFNVSLYRTDYSNLQTSVFDGVLGFIVQNAAEARAQGVEFDGRVAVTERLQIYGSGAYLDYKFTNFPLGQCFFGETPTTGIYCDREGFPNTFAPKWSGNVGFDYSQPLTGSLMFDLGFNAEFKSKYFVATNLDPNAVEDGYTRLAAQVGVGDNDGAWRLSFIGENLTNERIKTFGNALPLAGTLTGGTGNAYDSIYARPRNLTLKLDVRF